MMQSGLDIAIESRHLSPFLTVLDILNVSSSCRHFVSFRTQTNVLSLDGKTCSSLRSVYKYLKTHPTHVHVRLYLDELWGIDAHVSREVEILLLEPPHVWWTPYAVLKSVTWLAQLRHLKHLEVSLDRHSAVEFVGLLRENALLHLESLAAITNFAADHFWSALTHTPRLALRALSVSGFRLEYVPLTNVKNVRFLFVSRPYRHAHLYRFLGSVLLDLRALKFLVTLDFTGLARGMEMDAWMALFQGDGFSELAYWESGGSGIKDVDIVQKHLQARSQTAVVPLVVQGIRHFKDPDWTCGKHVLASTRRVGLHQHQVHRCLGGVLEQCIKTTFS